MWEPVDVIWDHDMEPALRAVNFSYFEDFHVVSKNITCHLEGCNDNYLNLWVFQTENPTKLSIFPLQEFFHGNPLKLFNRQRIDVYLDPPPSLDCGPFLFEFIHHLLPHEETFIGQLLYPIFSLFLKKIKPEPTLNGGSFFHQKFQMLVSLASFVHSEVLLKDCNSEDGAFWTFEHSGWDFDKFANIVFVSDTIEHLLFRWFV